MRTRLISSVTGWQLSRYGQLAQTGFPVIAGWRVATIARVVAVMLPPMAIFFPLFTMLEDFGFLPQLLSALTGKLRRVWQLQRLALTMQFPCGRTGLPHHRLPKGAYDCSPDQCLHALQREIRHTACRGGSLPAIRRSGRGATESLLPALLVTAMILLCVLLTPMVSRLLSATLLRGQPSAYLLEIPPYRVPDIPTVLVRSLLDRTLFVLGRAVAAAAPPAPCYGW